MDSDQPIRDYVPDSKLGEGGMGQAVPPPGQQPPVKKGPPKALWWILGGGAVGCLVLAALIMLAVYIAYRANRPEPIPFTDTENQVVEPVDGGVSPPVPEGGGDGDQQFREQIEGQLLASGMVYTAQGYTETHNAHIDRLEPDATDSINFELDEGVEYVLIGVCDTDCPDLDLRLKDENGNSIDEDFATDDFPIVEVTPAWTGRFDLEVVMADCDEAYCFYGVAVFGKR